MKENFSRNFGLAAIGSIAVNGGLFFLMSLGASQIAKTPDYHTVEVRRVEIDNSGKKVEKIVKPKEIEQKIKKLVEEKKIVPPKPKEPEKKETVPPPQHSKPQPKTEATPPPPQGAHNKVITAPPTNDGQKPNPHDFTALGGGNADVGKPTTGQNSRDAKVNPPDPPKQDPPKQEPPKQEPPKQDPPKQDPPKNDPPVEPPAKPPADPPKPKGPSKDAEPMKQVLPEIPDSLKNQDFRSFVRVVVEIDADGSFEVTLRTSSGNQEVDRRVLDALKKWKWKAALKDGEPVKSTQRFKFEFEVG